MKWSLVKLGKIVTIKGGGTPSRAKPEFYEGNIPWATIKDLTGIYLEQTQEHINYEAIKASATNLIPAGNIILATRMGLGKVAINTIDVAINQDLKALFCCQFINNKYLLHYLKSLSSSIEKQGFGATVKGITLKQVENWIIPLPPLSEQRRIVEILDQADALRRRRAEADAKAERILPALFIKMFGDPSTNPMGWETLPISDLAEVQGGLQVTPKRENHPISMPYLRVANIYRNKLALDEIKYMKVTKNELERIALQSDDILIVEGHGNRQEIGRCAIWDASIKPCLHQNHLIRVRVDKTKVEAIYISAFINSSGGREQLFRFGKTTSGLNTISVSNVKNTMIPVPPLTLQKSYALKVQAAKTIQFEIDKQREKIDKLFSCILQSAFSGELTTKWREAHIKELLAEIEEQAKALNLKDNKDSQQLSLL